MADARLSGKLETAIQALDNITKVYYSFLNAEPMSSNFAATIDTRFDLHLVPYKVMTSVHDAMKRNYVGLSENIAGLIENILALKVCKILLFVKPLRVGGSKVNLFVITGHSSEDWH